MGLLNSSSCLMRFLLEEVVPSENDDVNLWWFGAIVYVIGSIFINLGSNLIRYSHERIKHFDVPPPIYKRYWWIFGFAIFGLGNVFNFVGFMFAAQSLLVALGSIQFVSNLIFARLVNKEPITPKALVATVVIIIGNIIIVSTGNKTSDTYDLSQLLDLFLRPAFLTYIITIFVCVVILQSVYWVFLYRYIPRTEEPNPAVLKFMPIAYAATSAMIGTCSVTIGKALSGLLLQAFEPSTPGELKTVWPYMLLILFVVITAFWLYRMNAALRKYDAMFIIPVLQALWLLFAVLNGGIFYQEFADLSLLYNVLFGSGIVVLLFGVSIFSPRTEKHTEVVEDDLGAKVVVDHSTNADEKQPLL